ncbi:MAG: hypothetical protein JNK82_06880 [Myxococcaceae bacterium]|nr:hypothetical protein [Myxococcaceae bacterium]
MFIRRDASTRLTPKSNPTDTTAARVTGTTGRRLDAFRTAVQPAKKLELQPLRDLLPQKLGEARERAAAISEANELLLGAKLNRAETDLTITRDAPNVNDKMDTDETSERHIAADAQVQANAELETKLLEDLTPAEREQYLSVKDACLDANDPVAALALQKMLFEGKLPGAEDLAGEGTTLDHLATLADPNTPLAEGVDRAELVTDLVQELATPSAVNQMGKGTCAPTAVAIQLASQHPAEYARIVAGLASPEGTVVLAGGQTMKREPGTARDDGTGRSQVQQLMAPAFMEMANGDGSYTNSTDAGAGAWANTLDELYEQVMGRPMSEHTYGSDATPEEQAEAMEIMDDVLRAGGMVPMAIEYGGGLHKILVTGTTTIDGQEYVTYTNPWGREERMLRSEFEGRVVDISYDPTKEVIGDLKEIFGGLGGKKGLERDAERGRGRAIAV